MTIAETEEEIRARIHANLQLILSKSSRADVKAAVLSIAYDMGCLEGRMAGYFGAERKERNERAVLQG